MKNWYLIQTKPQQEVVAEENLSNQGYTVFNPQAGINNKVVALFPRYLFIHLDDKSQNWSPIRSTKGVSSFVRFGLQFAKVPESVIDCIQNRIDETREKYIDLWRLKPGTKVQITEGTFKGCEAIFNSYNADERIILLLKIIGQEQEIIVPNKHVVAV